MAKATSVNSASNADRLPSLDGWRALSILVVLAGHSRNATAYPPDWHAVQRWFWDGDTGVQVFFVISGFIITHLLLKEAAASGTVSLRNFYIRRFLRIVPAYAVFLAAVFVLTIVTTLHLDSGQWLRVLTWTSNFGMKVVPTPVGHIWSLSVEEQFYLLWPLSFGLLFALRNKYAALVIVLMLPIIVAPISRVMFDHRIGGPLFTYYAFFSQADSLAFGCLLAIVRAHHGALLSRILTRRRLAIALVCVLAMVAPLVLHRLHVLKSLTVPFEKTSFGLAIAGLIALSLEFPKWGAFGLLNTTPMRYLGLWSYSIYLWQQLFWVSPSEFYGLETAPWFMTFPYWLIPAIALGALSHYVVERPFLSLKDHWSQKQRAQRSAAATQSAK